MNSKFSGTDPYYSLVKGKTDEAIVSAGDLQRWRKHRIPGSE
jgi:hypothetical protein